MDPISFDMISGCLTLDGGVYPFEHCWDWEWELTGEQRLATFAGVLPKHHSLHWNLKWCVCKQSNPKGNSNYSIIYMVEQYIDDDNNGIFYLKIALFPESEARKWWIGAYSKVVITLSIVWLKIKSNCCNVIFEEILHNWLLMKQWAEEANTLRNIRSIDWLIIIKSVFGFVFFLLLLLSLNACQSNTVPRRNTKKHKTHSFLYIKTV